MITEKAYAKINLSLSVTGKREDGYHDLHMIMMPISLFDELTFELHDDIILDSNIEIENNAVIKTAKLIKDTYHVSSGVKITLHKNIPIGAGLAGGSADIAATIRGLNQLWDLNLQKEDLEKIALSLGSDTLFCLYNKPAYVFGRGENLLFVRPLPIQKLYLITPEVNVSTALVFKHHVICPKPKRFQHLLQKYINEKDHWVTHHMYNDLTKTTRKLYPEIDVIYKKLKKSKLPFLMSGSGSSFFIPVFTSNDTKFKEKITKIGLDFVETSPKT